MSAPSTRQLSDRIDMVPGDEDEEHGQCGLPLKEQQIVHRVRASIYSDIAWDCLRLQIQP